MWPFPSRRRRQLAAFAAGRGLSLVRYERDCEIELRGPGVVLVTASFQLGRDPSLRYWTRVFVGEGGARPTTRIEVADLPLASRAALLALVSADKLLVDMTATETRVTVLWPLYAPAQLAQLLDATLAIEAARRERGAPA